MRWCHFIGKTRLIDNLLIEAEGEELRTEL